MNRFYGMLPYFLIPCGVGVIFLIISSFAAFRVGDGSEYYALYFAWLDTARPWMSPASFESFQNFFDRRELEGWGLTAEQLSAAFSALRLGDTSDFNHFWLYSFLAFCISTPLNVLGIPLATHNNFILLHYAMVVGIFLALYRLYRWKGLIAAVIMTLLSPMLWYLNKVHTELFTFTFTLLAVAFIHSRLYLAGAFCLAVASTQNLSFALVAFIPFFYRIFVLRKQSLSTFEVLLAIGTALFVLLHPAYYFFRHGVITTQLLAGGADLGGNLSTFYIWLIDPDLGLFPNWPVGIAIILLALFIVFNTKEAIRSSDAGNKFLLVFSVLFFIINFYAHSSTTNINSGATPGPARYSLWYLPILFPALIFVLNNLSGRKMLLSLWVVILALGGWFNMRISDPREHDKVAIPSYLSSFLQTHFSRLYSPPHEVFSEKYSGFSERILELNPRAILGPDCAKMLVYPGVDRAQITVPRRCFYSVLALQQVTNGLLENRSDVEPFYAWLDEKHIDSVRLRLSPGEYRVGLNQLGNFILGTGWSGQEDFGIWSDGHIATLALPCDVKQFYFGSDKLHLALVVQPFGVQDLSVKHKGRVLYQGNLTTGSELNLELNPGKCESGNIELEINIVNPCSPAELGQSNDSRKLGVALLRYSLR